MKRKKRLLKGTKSLEQRAKEHITKALRFEKAGKAFAAEHARKEAKTYLSQATEKMKKAQRKKKKAPA